MSIRVVFDTNVVISALLFSKSNFTWLRESWSQKNCVPVVSTETTKELLRVLTYPKFKLTEGEQIELLGDFLPFAETATTDTHMNPEVPICRDKYDQKFINLAHTASVDFLVSSDNDLLVLNDHVEFSIITPAEFKNCIEK